MKQKIDFVLKNVKGIYRDVFRFYPRRTHVHSFDHNLPKSWEEVYKVYYTWSIIRQYYDGNENEKIVDSKIIFEIDYDECSMLPNLSDIIKEVIKTGETFDYPTIGQPSADWCIKRHRWDNKIENKDYEFYKFQVFNNWTNQGCRFELNKDNTLKFCNWLDKIN